MPAITTPSDSAILVTGANGFIATWTIGNLLSRGYTVRAAVRSKQKGEHLQRLYESFGSKLSLIVVGNMDKVLLQQKTLTSFPPKNLIKDLLA